MCQRMLVGLQCRNSYLCGEVGRVWQPLWEMWGDGEGARPKQSASRGVRTAKQVCPGWFRRPRNVISRFTCTVPLTGRARDLHLAKTRLYFFFFRSSLKYENRLRTVHPPAEEFDGKHKNRCHKKWTHQRVDSHRISEISCMRSRDGISH